MTADVSATIHLLRGDDTFSLNRRLEELLQGAGDPASVEMNTQRLDGKTASLDDIQTAVNTLPFFGGARWVIVTSAQARLDKSAAEKFTRLLEGMPPQNHLVLIAEDHPRWKKSPSGGWMQVWETLPDSHWLMKWISTHPAAEAISFALPDQRNMDAWMVQEAKRQGGKIEPAAAHELSLHCGNDTGIASQEIAKLLTYTNFKRAVTVQDVTQLVSAEGSTDVFVMLDALTEGDARKAQGLMHRLLEEDEPEVILGALSYRFRQLIQVREALDAHQGLQGLIERKVIFSNQGEKYTNQARRYSLARLENIYRRLLEIDLNAKTNFADVSADLETLVLEAVK